MLQEAFFSKINETKAINRGQIVKKCSFLYKKMFRVLFLDLNWLNYNQLKLFEAFDNFLFRK